MHATQHDTMEAYPRAANDTQLPALFMNEMPDTDHPDGAAISSMMGELTPLEHAENARQQGNDALKQGLALRKKFYLRKAVDHYGEGLAAGVDDMNLNSVLYANRAQAELSLGNRRNAMRDALRAVQLNPDNMKARFRAAKAALQLKLFREATTICHDGLMHQPDFPELSALLETIEPQMEKEERRIRELAEKRDAVRAPSRAFASLLMSRGWKIGRPQISIGSRKPVLEGDAVLWPVMLWYPEAMQHDTIEAFHEQHCLADHLDVMFGPTAPPLQWDDSGDYTRQRIQLYYLSYAAQAITEDELSEFLHGGWPDPQSEEEGPSRYGQKAASWVQVPESLSLAEVLAREDYVVPGIPVFFVVPEGSVYKDRFLNDDAFRP